MISLILAVIAGVLFIVLIVFAIRFVRESISFRKKKAVWQPPPTCNYRRHSIHKNLMDNMKKGDCKDED